MPGSTFVDERAEIGSNVVIGAGSRIWQFASVIRGADIGHNCNIGSCAIVDAAILGHRVIVGHGAFIGPGTVVDDDVFIGPGVIVCNDAWPRVDKAGFDLEELVARAFVTVRIKAGASLGAGAIVLPGRVIGEGAMIAAAAVVDQNVPPDMLFRRDGTMCTIDRNRVIARMRRAGSL